VTDDEFVAMIAQHIDKFAASRVEKLMVELGICRHDLARFDPVTAALKVEIADLNRLVAAQHAELSYLQEQLRLKERAQ